MMAVQRYATLRRRKTRACWLSIRRIRDYPLRGTRAYGAAYMLCRDFVDNGILGFVGGGLLYTVIFAAIALVLYGRTPEFKYFMQMMAKRKKK